MHVCLRWKLAWKPKKPGDQLVYETRYGGRRVAEVSGWPGTWVWYGRILGPDAPKHNYGPHPTRRKATLATERRLKLIDPATLGFKGG